MADRSGTKIGRLLFRCDGGVSTGLGHVSRCLALAEAMIERGFEVLFVGEHSAHVRGMIHGAGCPRRDAGGTLGSHADLTEMRRLATEHAPIASIVDSYAASVSYIAALGQFAPVAVLDDFARLSEYPCAAVLNVTATGVGLLYPPGPAKLLGPTYLLARSAVRRLGRLQVPDRGTSRVVVALGGVDRHGLTSQVLRALAVLEPALDVRVIVRADDEHIGAIREQSQSFAFAEVQTNLDSLAAAYAWADTCIAGGGLMKYECGLLGLPVGVLAQTEGEADDVRRCVEIGFVADLGAPEEPGRPIAARLERLLHDVDWRRALHDASLGVFGADPTGHAADGVLESVGAGKVMRAGGP